MPTSNLLYAQSGGVTAVMNCTAAGVISAASHHTAVDNIYAAQNGIIGLLQETLIDLSNYTPEQINGLSQTPSGAFGSCRYRMRCDSRETERLLAVLSTHNIRYLLYNGGGDSQDTTAKIARLCHENNYPLSCIGIPKTIDNDLANTDNCPGFGSVAKYVATAIREAAYDVASMAASSTKVFIMEVMGRHAGWIAASAGLAKRDDRDAPHLILFPEVCFDPQTFLNQVQRCTETYGFCTIVASEGIKTADGRFFSQMQSCDVFGHAKLGGVGPRLAELIATQLGYKYHWAVLDYLQRAGRHIASATDVEQATALGRAAVALATQGDTAMMPTIERLSDAPYRWRIAATPIDKVANVERKMPADFITPDGFGITEAAKRYLMPLIQGEAFPEFVNGLPNYARFNHAYVTKHLPPYEALKS